MSEPKRVISVGLVAVPESTASTLYGLLDVFWSVGRDWEVLVEGRTGSPLMEPHIVAARRGGFRGVNGAWIEAGRSFDEWPNPDIVCVPDLMVVPTRFERGAYPEAAAWLADCHRGGSVITSSCSGALLLADAGLLDDAEATTHWGYCDAIRSHFPRVRLNPAKTLVCSGIGQRLVTAGGGTAWHNLALYLIARFVGVERAIQIAKLFLLDWHEHGQLPYASLVQATPSDDLVIADGQAWLAAHFTAHAPVSAVIARSGLPERTFKRRFAHATGMSPIEYVHTLRLEAAKEQLETTNAVIEAIAENVGYEDGSFFRRLFRRHVGITPAEYRRRFSALRSSVAPGGAPVRSDQRATANPGVGG